MFLNLTKQANIVLVWRSTRAPLQYALIDLSKTCTIFATFETSYENIYFKTSNNRNSTKCTWSDWKLNMTFSIDSIVVKTIWFRFYAYSSSFFFKYLASYFLSDARSERKLRPDKFKYRIFISLLLKIRFYQLYW